MDANKEPLEVQNTVALREQLKNHLDIYKHHFDLFVKGGGAFLAVMGFVANIIYGGDVTDSLKADLCVLAAGGSLAGFLGGLLSLRWVMLLEAQVKTMAQTLEVPPLPFVGAKWVTLLQMFVSCLFFVMALWTRRLFL